MPRMMLSPGRRFVEGHWLRRNQGSKPAGISFKTSVGHVTDAWAGGQTDGLTCKSPDTQLLRCTHNLHTHNFQGIANYLLDMGSDPNSRNKVGNTPLFGAVEAGNRQIAKVSCWHSNISIALFWLKLSRHRAFELWPMPYKKNAWTVCFQLCFSNRNKIVDPVQNARKKNIDLYDFMRSKSLSLRQIVMTFL